MNNLLMKTKNGITNAQDKFVDALLGKAQTYEQPQMQIGQGNPAFVDALLQNPDYIAMNADVTNPNKQLKLDQIYQGLNHGSPSIAKLQEKYNIKKPQTNEEIELAKKLAFNSPITVSSGIANKPERNGGLLNNLYNGYNENYNQSFKPSNLEFGENKGLGYRIGEAAGTLGRIANSSLGRGLITAGIVGATGGSGLEALAYGGQAGLINQVAKKKDSLYRNELLNSYKQSIMNNPKYNKLDSLELEEIENYIKNNEAYIKASSEEEKNKIAANLRDILTAQRITAKQNEAIDNYSAQLAEQKGFINDSMYKQILNSQQLRDNAEYRNIMLSNQQEQNRIMNRYRQEQLTHQRQRAQMEDYYKRQGLNIQQSKLASDNYFRRQELGIQRERLKNQANKTKAGYQKYQKALDDNKDALAQIKDLKAAIKQNPGAIGLVVGSLANGKKFSQKIANEFTSSDPKFIQTRAAISKLRGTTMHDLAGTAQTAQEMQNLAPFLPDLTDSAKTALAKLDQLERELLREQNSMIIQGRDAGYFDVADEDLSTQKNTAAQVGNFKVRIK